MYTCIFWILKMKIFKKNKVFQKLEQLSLTSHMGDMYVYNVVFVFDSTCVCGPSFSLPTLTTLPQCLLGEASRKLSKWRNYRVQDQHGFWAWPSARCSSRVFKGIFIFNSFPFQVQLWLHLMFYEFIEFCSRIHLPMWSSNRACSSLEHQLFKVLYMYICLLLIFLTCWTKVVIILFHETCCFHLVLNIF